MKHNAFTGFVVSTGSPPTRGRGLKLDVIDHHLCVILVAPHAGAWIETPILRVIECLTSRPPRGGVD